jgi:hypothetical protein
MPRLPNSTGYTPRSTTDDGTSRAGDDGRGGGYVDDMGDEPLTNAVIERVRASQRLMNVIPELPAELRPEDIFADGYVFDDRRTGGVNYGQLDATAQFRGLEQFWLLGSQPHFSIVEVIAVRGERCAAYVEKVAYVEADMFMETIMVMKLDPALERSQRWVVFDPDDRDAAIAELDRMHAEIDD